MTLSNFNIQRSKHDIRHFYEWLSPEYQWAEHIDQWMEMYGDRRGASVHRVCIIAPRSHSKSATLRVKLLHMCLFEKRNNNPMEVWLFSASIRQATNRLEEIKTDMRRHPELRRFLDEKKSNKQKIQFTNGAWIQATGVGSAIRGEHPSVVALDDVLAEMGDMTMDSVREWFKKVITPMLDPGTSLFVVGTPMSHTDLYHTEMLSEKAKQVWRSGTWSAFPNWDEHKADPSIPLLPLWPEFRPTDFLLEQKISIDDDLAFAQEYLCKVVDDDSQVFNRFLIRENIDIDATGGFHEHFNGSNEVFVIGFDPSHGIGKDYTVVITLRQDEQGYVHFVDMWRRNDFPPDRQADVLIETAKQYNATVAAEDVGFQRLYSTIIEQKGGHIRYVPSKASNKGLKQGLLNRLRTWFERKLVVFPFGNEETRQKVGIIFDELEAHVWKNGEIVDVGKHNDTVMAFAHAIDQFKPKTVDYMPLIKKTTTMGGWGKAKQPPKTSKRRRPNNSKYVRFGGK
tara:strand:- start:1286 stop:2815 length:1530 start_codon:yes stop_codon:yes gene_type:complete